MTSSYRPSNQSPFGPDRSTGGRDTLLFLLSVGVAVTFLLGPPRWGAATAAGIRGTALVPFLWLQARAEEGKTSRSRFQLVEAERDSAAWAAQGLAGLRAENDRLRALLGIVPRVNVPYRPAEVMRQTQITDGRTLIVSAGSAAGVMAFDPVVAPDGLVGVVLTADRNTSVVMTWEHPEFRVSAATEDGGVLGTVAVAEGEEGAEAMLELRGVPYRDTVSVGTLVVTTGLGGVYPRGVPIGRVIGVAREQKGWERIYLIRPSVNLGATAHVLLLGHVPGEEAALAPLPKPVVAIPAAERAAAEKAAAETDSVRPRHRRRPILPPTTDSARPRPPDSARPRPPDSARTP